jgi:hypothetical protein
MKPFLLALLVGAAIVGQAKYARPAESSADISRLIQQLHDPDLDRRRDAASELSKISPLPPEGINAMASLLEQTNQDYVVENSAHGALCSAGVPAFPVATGLAHSSDKSFSQKAWHSWNAWCRGTKTYGLY